VLFTKASRKFEGSRARYVLAQARFSLDQVPQLPCDVVRPRHDPDQQVGIAQVLQIIIQNIVAKPEQVANHVLCAHNSVSRPNWKSPGGTAWPMLGGAVGRAKAPPPSAAAVGMRKSYFRHSSRRRHESTVAMQPGPRMGLGHFRPR